MKMLLVLMTALFTTSLYAIEVIDSTSKVLGQAAKIKCMSTDATCAISGRTFQFTPSPQTGGFNHFGRGLSSLTGGTSTTPSATTVYLSQIYVRGGATLTGVTINNAATVGTNKYIVALFDSAGKVVAKSAAAGALSVGANVYQAIPFTATVTLTKQGTYWIGLYVDGTTDRFYTLPAVDEANGLAGSATSQTFGTVAAVTLPTTFTADKGPVAFTY